MFTPIVSVSCTALRLHTNKKAVGTASSLNLHYSVNEALSEFRWISFRSTLNCLIDFITSTMNRLSALARRATAVPEYSVLI